MKKALYLTTLLFFISLQIFSQEWKVDRKQFYFGIGASNFLGDVGGSDNIGTHGLKDFNLSAVRMCFAAGYSYQAAHRIALKTNLIFGWIGGDDAYTNETFRHNRNINFRSIILELSEQFEFYILAPKANRGSSYSVYQRSWLSNIPLSLYVFSGVGGFYFNPKGKYTDGEWYSLQPLGTEGQGLVDTRTKYSLIQLTVPLGIGLKYRINQNYSIGLEYGLRKTFTDYLDDVSTTYFDKAKLNSEKGAMAAYFSNPSLTSADPNNALYNSTVAGQQRGNPSYNDSYMFALISLYYNFATKSHRFFRF